jgi:RNA polymerase sigma-70 factor (ECF subfamily)
MTSSLLRTEAEQDQLLLDIYELSRRFAVLKLETHEVDDFVQDLALHCLIRLRTGVWKHAPENVHGFVWKLVKNAVASHCRRLTREDAFQEVYATHQDDIVPEWVSPDRSADEEVLSSFGRQLVDKLPKKCREVYALVREEGMTEAEAALMLDISAKTAHNQMTIANRYLSKHLEQQGWVPGPRTSEGAAGTKPSSGDRAQFAPGYPAPPAKTAERGAQTTVTGV